MSSQQTTGRVVVLTVDGLGAGFLGPYGNTWIETPGANRLASESWLAENFFVEANDSQQFIASILQGSHAASRKSQDQLCKANLCDQIRDSQGRSILITDDKSLSECSSADAFDEVLVVENSEPARAEEVDETNLAKLFAGAIQTIEDETESSLIWVHSKGLYAVWDAPLEFRQQFADDEDPDPPELLTPPSLLLQAEHDPDEVTGISFACAGQVVAFDYCLAALHDCITTIPEANRPMLLLAGTRGFPLGEHGAIGEAANGFFEESIHVPLLIRSPDKTQAMIRSHSICQPHQVYEVVKKFLEPSGDDQSLERITLSGLDNDYAVLADKEQLAIRTAQWQLMCNRDQSLNAKPMLFAKPDDRWEVNEIASRCRRECEELEELLREKVAGLEKTSD